MSQQSDTVSTIIKKLPPIFHDSGGFLDNFLKAFEDVMMGDPGSDPESRASMKSVAYIIDNIDKYFDAFTAPPQFLQWLAGWVGYTLKKGDEYNHEGDIIENEYESPTGQHLPLMEERESYNRIFISKMTTLYQRGGTLGGIKEFIDFFVEKMSYRIQDLSVPIKDIVRVRIDEYVKPFVLGEHSKIARHSVLKRPRPYYFRVIIEIDSDEAELINRVVEDITLILEEEKPAHIYYTYNVVTQ